MTVKIWLTVSTMIISEYICASKDCALSKISWLALFCLLFLGNIGRVATTDEVNVISKKPFTCFNNFDFTANGRVIIDQDKQEKQNPLEKHEENREKEEDSGKHITKKSSGSNEDIALSHKNLLTFCQYCIELKKQVLDLAWINRKKTPLTVLFQQWKMDC